MNKLTNWLGVFALLVAIVLMADAAYTLNGLTNTLGALGESLAQQDSFI
ncbi:hypothetical protein THIOSC15_450001 [uncultured Thiomicrorhabdus sp.]